MKNKYFAFCTAEMFNKGVYKNAEISNDRLTLAEGGVWISSAIDSNSNDTIWDCAELNIFCDGI